MTSFAVRTCSGCRENLLAFRCTPRGIGDVTFRAQALSIGQVIPVSARSAPSSSTGQADGVCGVIRVAAGAVRFPRVYCRGAHSTHDVLFSRYWFKMRRIHARTVATQVIKYQPSWDWPYEPFVCQSVPKTDSTSQLDLRVGVSIESAAVFPATRLDVADRSRHEALKRFDVVQPFGQWTPKKFGKTCSSGQLLGDRVKRRNHETRCSMTAAYGYQLSAGGEG